MGKMKNMQDNVPQSVQLERSGSEYQLNTDQSIPTWTCGQCQKGWKKRDRKRKKRQRMREKEENEEDRDRRDDWLDQYYTTLRVY